MKLDKAAAHLLVVTLYGLLMFAVLYAFLGE
jgi:hypothetical protein